MLLEYTINPLYFPSYFLLQTFNLNDRSKKSLLTSVGSINKFTADSSVPVASVEIKTKKWNSAFQTSAGSEANYIKKNRSGELKVIQLLLMKRYHNICFLEYNVE